jgi:hypothetical protein
MFAWFFPIIAALPLPRADSYLGWVWLSAWG